MADLIHLKSPMNWINDPNGFIFYKGKYHLFYQWYPYNTHWGTMHWGHAISDDLISWEHLGIALYPSKDYDMNGVFSGSAIDINGVMHLYYTGAKYITPDPENTQAPVNWGSWQSQALITSEDGFNFDNIKDKKQIIPVIEDKEIADPLDTRDPKVWRDGDTYYMCLASTHNKEKGVLLVYRSSDAINWELYSRVESESLGSILECPDMFKIEDKWILISSPIGILMGTEYPENQAVIRFMNFNPDNGDMSVSDEYTFLDYGMDIYAPQSTLDKDGNRTVISWVRMPEAKKLQSDSPVKKEWIGMMTMPRIVEVKDGIIYTRPHDKIRKYFEKESKIGTDSQIIKKLSEGESIVVDGVKISLEEGMVVVDRTSRLPKQSKLHAISKTPFVGQACELEIYDSADLIEVFVDGGKYVITNVKY